VIYMKIGQKVLILFVTSCILMVFYALLPKNSTYSYNSFYESVEYLKNIKSRRERSKRRFEIYQDIVLSAAYEQSEGLPEDTIPFEYWSMLASEVLSSSWLSHWRSVSAGHTFEELFDAVKYMAPERTTPWVVGASAEHFSLLAEETGLPPVVVSKLVNDLQEAFPQEDRYIFSTVSMILIYLDIYREHPGTHFDTYSLLGWPEETIDLMPFEEFVGYIIKTSDGADIDMHQAFAAVNAFGQVCV